MSSGNSAALRPYGIAFLVLVALTAAEVGVLYVPGISDPALVSALVLLAVAKAAVVLLCFMHLGSESRGLRLSVLLPFLLPAGYALALIGEAAWRFSR